MTAATIVQAAEQYGWTYAIPARTGNVITFDKGQGAARVTARFTPMTGQLTWAAVNGRRVVGIDGVIRALRLTHPCSLVKAYA